MPLKSTPTRYGAVAVTIHWITALLIVALLVTGFRIASLDDAAAKVAFLSFHAPTGILILLLTVLRVLWWWLADRKPAAPADDPAWQTATARLVHVLFYVVIFVMAASGIGMMLLSGAGAILLGDAPVSSLPDFDDFIPHIPHGIGAFSMIALLVFHAGAALYHHFVRRDGLLWRMWFARG